MNYKHIFPIEFNYMLKNGLKFLNNSKINNIRKQKRTVFYLDSASYLNIGDQAIAYAIEKFIINELPEFDFVQMTDKQFPFYYVDLKKKIKEEDIIVLSGGGNMGVDYPKYEAIRRKIIRSFPKNKIIIFPQTIDYNESAYAKKAFAKSKKLYNSHTQLYLCARERKSYDLMKKSYINVLLIPDIVFYLYPIKLDIEKQSNKIGICFRQDNESTLEKNFDIQWNECIEQNGDNAIILTTTPSSNTEINIEHRERAVIEKIREFAKNRCIITDRLHGMIFSIITDTQCIAYDNKNKKVSGVLEIIRPYLQKELVTLLQSNTIDSVILKKCNQIEKSEVQKIRQLYLPLVRIIRGEKE